MPKKKLTEAETEARAKETQEKVARDLSNQIDSEARAVKARENIIPLLTLLKRKPEELIEDLKELYHQRVDNPDQINMLPDMFQELGVSESELESELSQEMVERLRDRLPPIAGPRLKKMDTFLTTYRATGNRSLAASEVGASTITIGLWAHHYPQFKMCLELVKEQVIDDLEQEARRRAFQGVLEPTGWYQGQPGAYVRRYSDNLLMFLIKAHRPQFRDTTQAQGSGGVAVQVSVTNWPSDSKDTDVIDVSPSKDEKV